MFCLLVVLVKLSLLAKWLARKTPLRKPNRGEGIISIKPRRKRAYDCVGLLYSFVVLLHDICVLPRPYVIHFLLLWHDIAYLCWKCHKTPTNWLKTPLGRVVESALLEVTLVAVCSVLYVLHWLHWASRCSIWYDALNTDPTRRQRLWSYERMAL